MSAARPANFAPRRQLEPLRACARVALAPLRSWVRNHRLKARKRYFLQQTPPAPYDAIHCHDLDTLPAAQALRTALAPNAKLIYDAHELFPYQEPDRSFQRYWSAIEAKFIPLADLVITVNESVAEQLALPYGIRTPEVIYNSCGDPSNDAPLSLDEFYQRFHAPAGGFRVLFQGGLHPLRNLPNLVRAFARLDDSYGLFIIGTGPLEAKLRALCNQQRSGNVHFGGFIPPSELLRYTAHADLGIIPYEDGGLLNMRYCTPNKLFEFIEAGVPICASDLPELARVVVENNIGAVYLMRSPDDIAAAIQDCRHLCERGDFALACRQQARRRFAWSEQAKRLIALYEQLGV
jgi:glycosyltransferase involved in cell wall biosynthesis